MRPDTQYARCGELYIAYQVFGEGPFDLVVAPGLISNIEYGWESPDWAAFHTGLASFARVILFDKRSTGVSDRIIGAATLEERMEDVRAVMDAADSERAAIYGSADSAALALLFAATFPERAPALVLWGPRVRSAWARDYPWGIKDRTTPWSGLRFASREHVESSIARQIPSKVGDPEFARHVASFLRLSATPTTYQEVHEANLELDVRQVLPSIRSPTLVLHRTGPWSSEPARYAADRITGARLVEIPGEDRAPYYSGVDRTIATIREFLTDAWESGAWEELEPDRVLATVLFTDLVGSTERAAQLGDRAWADLLREHHAVVRRQLARFRGKEVDTAGDGFFASFDGPARAIRCASAIVGAVQELGLEIRAGLHTGECEVIDGKVGGIAVHLGARVASQARPGEVIVSSTVKDLVAGSGINFENRGSAELKGVPGSWPLYAVLG